MSEAAAETQECRWRPHPDDEVELSEAVRSAEHGEALSCQDSEAFLLWMEGEGGDDEQWRVEFE